MNTAAAEMAASVEAPSVISILASPPAVLKNTRYVGALSRKDESNPVAQKYIALFGCPAPSFTRRTIIANGPSTPALSMAMTGPMVMKMPAKSLATSRMGSQLNSLPVRALAGVSHSDSKAMQTSPMSRTTFCSNTSVPITWKTIPGFHRPLISTRPRMPASRMKLTLPSKRRGPASSGVASVMLGSSSLPVW